MNEHILQLLNRGNKMRLGPLMHEKGIPVPCYPDIRSLYSRPHYLRVLATEMALRIEHERIDLFAAIPFGGFPLAVALAMTMNRPFICVRPFEKHSLRPKIEGVWRKGQRVALVDDSLTMGKAKQRAYELLVEAGMRPTHILVIMEMSGFLAESKQRAWLKEKGVKVISLVTWHEWVHFMEREGEFSKETTEALLRLLDNPPAWVKD